MMRCVYLLFAAIFISISSFSQQQDEEESVRYADQYLDSRTTSLDKYLDRAAGIQQRLLKKLQRKEARFARKLAAKDSTLYQQYLQNKLSYDSIAALSKDSTALSRIKSSPDKLIDSLKGIQRFISNQGSKLGTASSLAGQAGVNLPNANELSSLQQKLNAQQGLDQLMQQRSKVLESLAGAAHISGIEGIQKDLYYAQSKMKAWKALADDPDAAEEKAMEYLQGTEGFQQYLNQNNNAFGGLGNDASEADLQRLGYQTKSQVNGMLQQKLGSSLGSVQQQMGQQVQQYSEKLNDITGKVSEAKNSLNEAKQTLNDAKQTAGQLKHIEKPGFVKNPERGKPFWQRLEVQYNFQTSRATPDGLRPAMLDLGASVAFKHTPRLSYGIGLALSTGLGQNWQNIKFSYEGITARAFLDYKMIYGFSAQAGYERAFRPDNRAYLPEQQNGNTTATTGNSINAITEAFGGQQQAAYLGIMKRYRIGGKWSGTFLLGYNFLWQQEDLRSPFLLRFGWDR
ncbi:hypothetical protein ACFJIV_28820 [Mucilaginibacter sp. UC70_90]